MFNKVVKGFVVGLALMGSLTMVGCESTESVLEEDPVAIENKLLDEAYNLGMEDGKWYKENISANEVIEEQVVLLIEDRYYANEIPSDGNDENDPKYIGYYTGSLLKEIDPNVDEETLKRILDTFVANKIEYDEFMNSNALTEEQAIQKMEQLVTERFGALNVGLFRLKYDFINDGATAVGIVEAVQTGKEVLKITIDMKYGKYVVSEIE